MKDDKAPEDGFKQSVDFKDNMSMAVVYVKEKWYHLWGYLCIWAHPSNIRAFAEEARQSSTDYDLKMGKVWSWQASSIRSAIASSGFSEDSGDQKFYKKWAKESLLGVEKRLTL